MIPLNYYTENLKVRGVVRMSAEVTPIANNRVRINEEVVCISGEYYKEIHVIRIDAEDPYNPHFRKSETLITEVKYESLKGKYGVIDTKWYWKKVNRYNELKGMIELAYKEGIPKCPVCGAKTEIKNRHYDGRPFWSCKRYPSCIGLVDIDKAGKVDTLDLTSELESLSIEIKKIESGTSD